MSQDRTPNALLIESSRQGNLRGLRQALAEGADVDTRDEKGRTPLMCAALISHLPAVTFLLEHGANPLIRDNDGQTVLERATPVYIAVQREIVGNALDGINTEAGTEKSIRWARLIAALEQADRAARERKIDFSKPVQQRIRVLRPPRYRK